MADVRTLTIQALRAELEQRGLSTTGKKVELVARLEAAISTEAPTSPAIPVGFDVDLASATALAKIRLDIDSFSTPLRKALAQVPGFLFATADPTRGAPLEQVQRVLDAVSRIRQVLGLSSMKRAKKQASPQAAIVHCMSDLIRALSNKGALDASLATSLEVALSRPADEGDDGEGEGEGHGGGGGERVRQAARLAELEAEANALRAQLGGAAPDAVARRREIFHDRLADTVIGILASPSPSGAPPSHAQERAVGHAIISAVGGSAAALPDPAANLVTWRMSVCNTLADAAITAEIREVDISALEPFLWASALASTGDPRAKGARACRWDTFYAARHSVASPAPTAALQTRITWALEVFRHLRWVPEALPTGPTAPQRRVEISLLDERSPSPSSSSDDERRAPRRRLPKGESQGSVKEWRDLGIFADQRDANPRLACGAAMLMGPVGAAGVATAHCELAQHFARGASTVSLRDVFDSERDYALLRLSPTTMASSAEDHFAILTAATEGFDVLTGANQSFAANAVRDLVADGKGLALSLEPVSGAIVVNRSFSHDLGGAASGFVTFWSEHVEPRAMILYNEAARGRPRFASVPAPPTSAVPPCKAVTRFIGAAMSSFLNDVPRRIGPGLTPWVKALVIHDFIFEGNVHLRWHPGIESELTNMAVAARQASSLAAAPAYFNYALCDSFKPSFWPASQVAAPSPPLVSVAPPPALPVRPAQRVSSGRRGDSEQRARAPFRRDDNPIPSEGDVTAAASLASSPWVFRNLDAKRLADHCPHCGPGHGHALGDCKLYSLYLRSTGALKIPHTGIFPVGASLRLALAGKKTTAGSKN